MNIIGPKKFIYNQILIQDQFSLKQYIFEQISHILLSTSE